MVLTAIGSSEEVEIEILMVWRNLILMALVVKTLPANAGDIRDVGSIPRLGRSPGGGHGNPLQYSCLESPNGQGSLVGYSPCGRQELDTTETTEHDLE